MYTDIDHTHRYYGLLLWFPEYFKCVYQSENNCILSSNEGHRCAPNVTAICNSTGSSLYLDNLYTALATIPATVLGIITVNILGGKLMLGAFSISYSITFLRHLNFMEWPLKAFPGHAFNLCTLEQLKEQGINFRVGFAKPTISR